MPIDAGTAKGYLDLDISGFLDSLQTAQQRANSALQDIDKQWSQDLKTVGDSMSKTGTALTAGVTAPVVGLGAAAVKTTMDFDTSMSNVKALSGATAEEFDALREKAQEMGAKTSFSAKEAADAFGYMALAGWDSSQMIGGIEGVLNLAAAGQTDLATTSDIVTDALTAFGLTADDSAHFADVLAKTMSSSNTDVLQMGEAFKYVGAIAGTAGYSIEDVSLALGLMGNNGIKASQAGTTLRRAITNLAAPTGEASKMMEQLGITATDSEGNMLPLRDVLQQCRDKFADLTEEQQAQAASAIFGQQAMSGMLAIINSSQGDWDKLSSAIDNADGTAQSMADTLLDNLGGQLTILKSSLEGLAIQFGDVLLPHIKNFVEKIQDLVHWFQELSPEQKDMIVKFAGIAAAAGPVLLVTGKLVSGFGSLIGTFGTLSSAIPGVISGLKGFGESFAFASGSMMEPVQNTSKLGTALGGLKSTLMGLPAPVYAVVAVIAVLAAAFVNLWQNNDEFRQKMTDIWTGFCDKINEAFQGVVDAINAFGFNFKDITEVLGAAWNELCNLLAPVFEGAFEIITNVIAAVAKTFGGFIKIISGLIRGDWADVWEGAQDIFGGVWDAITGILSGAADAIGGVIDTILGWFGVDFEKVLNDFKKFWGGVWDGIVKFFTDPWGQIKNFGQGILDWFSGTFGKAWDGIVKTFTSVWDGVSKFFGGIVDGIKNVFQGIIDFFVNIFFPKTDKNAENFKAPWDLISGAIEAPINAIKSVFQGIVDFFGSIFGPAIDAAGDAFRAVWDGIGEFISDPIGKVQSAFEGFGNWLGDVFSPDQETREKALESIWSGFSDFMANAWNVVKDTGNNLLDWFENTFNVDMQGVRDTFNNIWQGIADFFTNPIESIKNAGIGLIDWFQNTFNVDMTAVKDFFVGIWDGIANFFSDPIGSIRSAAEGLVNWFNDAWNNTFSGVGSFFESTWNQITEWGSGFFDAAFNAGSDFLRGIGDTFGNLASTIGGFFTEAFNKISEFIQNAPAEGGKVITEIWNGLTKAVTDVWDNLVSIGGNILKGITDGITSACAGIADLLRPVTDGIVGAFKTLFGISSPSTVMNKEVGVYMPPGIADGFEKAMPDATVRMTQSAEAGINDVFDAAGRRIGVGADLVQQELDRATGGFSSSASDLKKTAGDLGYTVEDTFNKSGRSIRAFKDEAVADTSEIKTKAIEDFKATGHETLSTLTSIKDETSNTADSVSASTDKIGSSWDSASTHVNSFSDNLIGSIAISGASLDEKLSQMDARIRNSGETAKESVTNGWGQMPSIMNDATTKSYDYVDSNLSQTENRVSQFGSNVSSTMDNTGNQITQWGDNFIRTLLTALQMMLDQLTSAITGGMTNVNTQVTHSIDDISTDMFDSATRNAGTGAQKLKSELMQSMVNAYTEPMYEARKQVLETSAALGDGIGESLAVLNKNMSDQMAMLNGTAELNQEKFISTLNTMVAYFGTNTRGNMETVAEMRESISNDAVAMDDNFKGALQDMATASSDKFGEMANTIETVLQAAMSSNDAALVEAAQKYMQEFENYKSMGETGLSELSQFIAQAETTSLEGASQHSANLLSLIDGTNTAMSQLTQNAVAGQSANLLSLLDTTQNGVNEMTNLLLNAVNTNLDTFARSLEQVSGYSDQMAAAFEESGGRISDSMLSMSEDAVGKFASMGQGIQEQQQRINDLVKSGAIQLNDDVVSELQTMLNDANAEYQQQAQDINSWLVEMVNSSDEEVAAQGRALYNELNATLANVDSSTSETAETLTGYMQGMFDDVSSKTADTVTESNKNLSKMMDETKSKAQKGGNDAQSAFATEIKKMTKELAEILQNTISKLVTFATDVQRKGENAGDSLNTGFKNRASQTSTSAHNIGIDIVNGLWNGINGVAGSLFNNIGSFCNNIINTFTRALGIGSPSKVMSREVGRWLPPGIVDGYERAMPEAMDDIQRNITNEIKGIRIGDIEAGKISYTSDLTVLTDQLTRWYKLARGQFDDFVDGINNVEFDPLLFEQSDGMLSNMLMTNGYSDLNPLANGIDYDMLSFKLAEVLRKAPISNDVTVEMADGDIYLDNERVGRKQAPVISRILSR